MNKLTGEQKPLNISAVILAGGQSRRIGQDKALLKVGGQAIICRVLERLKPFFAEVMIVGSQALRFGGLGVKVVPDELPKQGPLGGIYTGLKASDNEWVFCCACDMPFLSSDLISALASQANQLDAVVCKWENQLQPLHGFYHKSCLPIIQGHLQKRQKRLLDIFPQLQTKYLDEQFIANYDPQGYSFFNLNTPDALNQAEKIAREIK